MNKCILLGNLTKDWELKTTPTSKVVGNNSMATNKRYKDANGKQVDAVQFHNLVVWGKLAETLNQYTKKGHKIYIEGELQTRNWEDKDTGKKIYRTEIVVSNFEFLEKKTNNQEETPPTSEPTNKEEKISVDNLPF